MHWAAGFVPVAHESFGAARSGCAASAPHPAAVEVPSTTIEFGYLVAWRSAAEASGMLTSPATNTESNNLRIRDRLSRQERSTARAASVHTGTRRSAWRAGRPGGR